MIKRFISLTAVEEIASITIKELKKDHSLGVKNLFTKRQKQDFGTASRLDGQNKIFVNSNTNNLTKIN